MISSLFRLRCHLKNTNWIKGQIIQHICKNNSVLNVAAIVQRNEERKYGMKHNEFLKYNLNHRKLTTAYPENFSLSPIIFTPDDNIPDFKAVFPEIVRELIEDDRHQDIQEVNHWLGRVLKYTVPFDKRKRPVQFGTAYKMFEKPENITAENLKLAHILGWCWEMLLGAFIIYDDIIDANKTRQGMPCWYELEDVGLSGFNDAILVENCIYVILKKYFHNHPNYVPIMELFHDMALKTAMGQCLDSHTYHQNQLNVDVFSKERYHTIQKYKTCFIMHMPVEIAMYLVGILDQELHKQAKYIMFQIGHFLQSQNDFFDCYGDPEITGKDGMDISEGRSTWLCVMAWEKSTQKQKDILKKFYGKNDTESVESIKDIYKQLGLVYAFAIYEKNNYYSIKAQIQQMSDRLPKKLFDQILDTAHGRQKSTI